jgi:phage terminase small subunit
VTQRKLNPKNKGGKKAQLTPRMKLFVREYRKDFNAQRAYRDAGYVTNNADVNATKLLKIPMVQAAIAEVVGRAVEKAELSADRVLEELRRVVFADIGNYFDADGNLIAMHLLTPEQRSALASVEVVVKNVSAGDGKVDYVHKIKLWDKMRAQEMALKYHGLLKENVNHTHTLVQLAPEKVALMSDEELEACHKAAEILSKLARGPS